MIVALGIALAAALSIVILYRSYRRQIHTICRQLAFVREHETNLLLRSQLPQKELDALIDEINELLDSAREAKRSAEQNSEALREMIANLSHDIRTPLTSLDGYFQLLAESENPEDTLRYLGVIRGRIDSLKEMLEELFGYTKLQDPALHFEISRFDLTRLVSETALSFCEDFVGRGITPTIDFPEESLEADSDPEALRRILQNLLKNALEHGKSRISLKFRAGGAKGGAETTPGGEAVGATGRTTGNITGSKPGDGSSLEQDRIMWSFHCSNDVAHPEQINVERVFQRFYKADGARSRTSTGLGLAIAQTLSQRLGLELSASLEGDEFTVTLIKRARDRKIRSEAKEI